MTAVALATLAGALLAAGLWATSSRLFEAEALARTNYRGAELCTGVGVLIPLSVTIAVAAGHLALLSTGRGPLWYELGRTTVLATTLFALLGLVDDVAGAGQSGGFRQHVAALFRGELTSGAVKMIGGAAAGVLVASASPAADGGLLGGLRDGAIVALAANLANLLDRAPGRAIKFSAVGFLVAVAISRRTVMAGPAVGIGAGLGLVVPDLRERMMIGDAGSNALGALVGLAWLVAAPDPSARWALLAAVVALNALSEWVSYSALIDAVAPVRWFDRLGSQRS